MNNKLGGKLIGYEIRRDGKIKKSVRFDKPIHNTITKACLNNLLTFDGTNTISEVTSSERDNGNYLSIFIKSSQSSQRYGVINYSALGDGVGDTSVDDIALKHQVGGYTDTKQTGTGYCETYWDNDNSIIKIRVSHQHTISNSFTVKEIGWFNRYYGTDTYDLSARVTLDNPVDVDSGDIFVSIYEIDISFQQETIIADFFNLGVPCKKVNANIGLQRVWYEPLGYSYPFMGTDGNPTIGGVDYRSIHNLYNGLNKSGSIFWTSNQNVAAAINGKFPGFGTDDWGDSSGNVSYSINNYSTDSFYRDATIILSPAWAANTDIYALVVNGIAYVFGEYDQNNIWVPQALHKDNDSLWTIKFRQRWATDLLVPAI